MTGRRPCAAADDGQVVRGAPPIVPRGVRSNRPRSDGSPGRHRYTAGFHLGERDHRDPLPKRICLRARIDRKEMFQLQLCQGDVHGAGGAGPSRAAIRLRHRAVPICRQSSSPLTHMLEELTCGVKFSRKTRSKHGWSCVFVAPRRAVFDRDHGVDIRCPAYSSFCHPMCKTVHIHRYLCAILHKQVGRIHPRCGCVNHTADPKFLATHLPCAGSRSSGS